MRKSKFSEEQIIGFLKQAEAGGVDALVLRGNPGLEDLGVAGLLPMRG